jgi:hypothetical protein
MVERFLFVTLNLVQDLVVGSYDGDAEIEDPESSSGPGSA